MMFFHNAKIPNFEQLIRNRRIPWSKYRETRLSLTTVVQFQSMCPPFIGNRFGHLISDFLSLRISQSYPICNVLISVLLLQQ